MNGYSFDIPYTLLNNLHLFPVIDNFAWFWNGLCWTCLLVNWNTRRGEGHGKVAAACIRLSSSVTLTDALHTRCAGMWVLCAGTLSKDSSSAKFSPLNVEIVVADVCSVHHTSSKPCQFRNPSRDYPQGLEIYEYRRSGHRHYIIIHLSCHNRDTNVSWTLLLCGLRTSVQRH